MGIPNEECIKKLNNLSIMVLIWPSIRSKNTFRLKLFQCYSLLMAVLLTVLFVWSTKGRYKFVYTEGTLSPILSVLDQISQTFFHISTLISSISLTFFSRDSYQDFSQKIHRMSRVLKDPWIEFTNLFKLLLVFLIFIATAVSYDAYVWLTTVGLECYQFYFLKSVQFLQCCLNAFIMFSYSLLIKSIFKKLYEQLKIEMESKFGENFSMVHTESVLSVPHLQITTKNHVKHRNVSIIRVHNELCNLVDEFNSVFGFNLLLIVFNCIINVLFNAGLCAIYALKSGKDLNGVSFGTELMISRFQWITVSLVLPVMLATACGSAEKEARRIIPLTLTYLNKVPLLPKTQDDLLLKEELSSLCRQAQLRSPEFSAAGFFTVNHTMLGFIMGSVTSYIIVTLQLAGDDITT